MYIYVLYGYVYPHCNIHRFSIPGQNTIFSWLAWPQWFKDLHLLSPHGHRMLCADVEDVFRQAWCLDEPDLRDMRDLSKFESLEYWRNLGESWEK